MKKIVVEPPVSDARRERVERQLFTQLAAVRVADRAEAVIPPVRKSRAAFGFALAGFAVAALAIVLLITRDGDRGGTVASPSRVVTPVGGESRFTVGDAVIDAKSDTSVEVQQGSDGSITLVLARGTIDCDVEPRAGRPPFRVVAGELKVEVIGTRFAVSRTPSPRVDVTHGKVRVEAPGGTWLVEAGESWPVTQTAVAPAPVDDAEEEIEIDPARPATRTTPRPKKVTPPAVDPTAPKETVEPPTTRELSMKAHKQAQLLESSNPEQAARLYRAIATESKDPGWAAIALVSLAELQLKLKDPKAALTALDEHATRFPKSVTREDAAWFRIEALKAMGKRDQANGAAADYLREFPDGAFADRLRAK